MFWRKRTPAVQAATPAANVTPPTPAAPRNGRKILLIDDDAVHLKALSAKLDHDGFNILSAPDCSQGLALMREECPDLILLDLMFPADVGSALSDGPMLMKWTKQFRDRPPIFVITSCTHSEVEEQVKAMGADRYFIKGFRYEELSAAVEEELGLKTNVVVAA